jgi:hypothetical protein
MPTTYGTAAALSNIALSVTQRESRPLPHCRILYSGTIIVLMVFRAMAMNDSLVLTKIKLARSGTMYLGCVYTLVVVKLIE